VGSIYWVFCYIVAENKKKSVIVDNETNHNNSKHFSSKVQSPKHRIDNDINQW